MSDERPLCYSTFLLLTNPMKRPKTEACLFISQYISNSPTVSVTFTPKPHLFLLLEHITKTFFYLQKGKCKLSSLLKRHRALD